MESRTSAVRARRPCSVAIAVAVVLMVASVLPASAATPDDESPAQGGVESTRQLLVAASYNVSRRLVLDAGAARSLRSGAPVWSAFTGFTWLAARVF